MAEHKAQFNSDYTLASGSWYRKAGRDGLDLGVVFGAPPASQPLAPRNLRITQPNRWL